MREVQAMLAYEAIRLDGHHGVGEVLGWTTT